MRASRHHRPFVTLACLLLFLDAPARAADYNWDAGAGSQLWSAANNWAPNVVPGLADALVFTGASLAGPQTIDLAGNQRIDHVFTNGVSGVYTFTNSVPAGVLELFGTPDLTLILTQNPDNGLIFDTNVSYSLANRFYINSDQDGGKIIFSPGRTLSTTASSDTTTLNFTSRNTTLDYAIEVHSVIADGPGARMALEAGYDNDADAHIGRVLVTAANTYTGPTSVNGATLAFTSITDVGAGPSALGNPALADATINLGTNKTSPNNIPGTLRYVGTLPAGHSSNRPFQFVGFSPGGTIEASGAGPLVLSGGLTSTSSSSVNRTLTLAGANTGNNTFSGVIADVPGTAVQHLAKTGPGTWILSAPNTYLGQTTVTGGVLVVGTGGAIGAGGAAGRILVDGPTDLRLAGGTITATELDVFNDALLDFRSGTLNLTGPAGSALYGRATPQIGIFGPGTLNLGAFTEANALIVHDADDAINLAPGATLSTIALSNTAGGTVSLPAGSTLTLINPNFGFTTGAGSVAGAITGAGSLTKVGPGTFTVSSSLTYTGDTTVSEGTLHLTPAGRIHDASNLIVNVPGTFESDAAPDAVFSLNGDGTVNLLNNAGFVVGNFDNAGGTGTFTGIIQGDGTLDKRGTGILTLTGNNTYLGKTFVREGVLAVRSIADIGAPASALGAPGTAANATIEIGSAGEFPALRYAGTDPAGHSSNRPIHLPADSATIDASGAGPLVLSGPITTAGVNTRTLFLSGSNTADNTYAGAIPAIAGPPTLGLTKSGPGRWVLTGANAYDGPTTITGGELVVRGPTGAINTPGTIDVNATATLILDGGSLFTPDLDFNGGSFLFKSGTLTLGTGTHTFPAGNLTIGTDGPATMTLGTGIASFDALTLHGPDDSLAISAGSATFNSLDNSHGGSLLFTGGTISVNTGQVTTAAGTIGGVLAGTGGLTKISDGSPSGGTLSLASGIAHAYTGPTTISAGTLAVLGTANLPDTSSVTIGAGATLDLSASDGETVGPLSGAGTLLTSASASVTVNETGTSTTFSGSVTGGGGFTKSGSGFLALTGQNTYTGATTVSAGILFVHSGGAITSTSALNVTGSAILTLGHPTLPPGSITTGTFSVSPVAFNWIAGTLHLTGYPLLKLSDTQTPNPLGRSLILTAGRNLIVDGLFSVYDDGTLLIDGGSLTVNDLGFGTPTSDLRFNTGTLAITKTGFSTLTASFMESADIARPLGPGRNLQFAGGVSFAAPLVLAGGTLSVNSLGLPQNLILSSGTFNITSTLFVPAGTSRDLPTGATLNANGGITIAATASLNATGGTLNANGPSTSAGPVNAINSTLHFPAGLSASAPVNLIASTVTGVISSTSTITAAGLTTLPRITGSASLTLAGPATLPPDAGPSTLASLSLAPGASLDLSNNSLSLTTTPAETLRQYLRDSFLFSSLADSTHSLGYLATGPSASLVQLTLAGDANLDGTLDADDFALLDRSLSRNQTNALWSDGDFNYDGTITPADYLLIDTAYLTLHPSATPTLFTQRQSQFGPTYVSQFLSLTPEPSLLAACGLALPTLNRRRRI